MSNSQEVQPLVAGGNAVGNEPAKANAGQTTVQDSSNPQSTVINKKKVAITLPITPLTKEQKANLLILLNAGSTEDPAYQILGQVPPDPQNQVPYFSVKRFPGFHPAKNERNLIKFAARLVAGDGIVRHPVDIAMYCNITDFYRKDGEYGPLVENLTELKQRAEKLDKATKKLDKATDQEKAELKEQIDTFAKKIYDQVTAYVEKSSVVTAGPATAILPIPPLRAPSAETALHKLAGRSENPAGREIPFMQSF